MDRIAMHLVCALLALAAAADAFAQSAAPEVRRAVEGALRYVTDKTLTWKEDHNCASCHHAPQMLWASYEAKKKGYAVNEDAVAEVRKWVLSPDNAARILPAKEGRADFNIFSSASMYVMLALADAPPQEGDADAVKRFRDHCVAKQEADGSFLINGSFKGTPPVLEGGSNATCLARLAFAALPGLTPEYAAADARAAAWIEQPQEHSSQQELALRLLVAARVSHPATLEAQGVELLALQNPDGSWSQTPEMAGDAYATGQALYALMAAGLRPQDPPIADAVAFLLRTQCGDGSWPMMSRTRGPNGEGAKNLEPITAAATAWALLGILAAT